MNNATIEQRLTALERQMEEVKGELERSRKDGNWIAKVTGSFKDDPDFGEILRLGREARQADRLLEDEQRLPMYLLDTDHLPIIQWQTQPDYQVISQHLQLIAPADVFTSIISFHEEVRGWNRYVNVAKTTDNVVKAYAKFDRILTDFSAMQVLPFAAAAGLIFDQLRSQRIRIGTMDLRLAAIAIANDLTLVTRNFVDFTRVPGLRLEDWTVPPLPKKT